MKKSFRLINEDVKRRAAAEVMQAPEGYICEIKERTRSIDQNALMWSVLTDISKQVDFYVDGEPCKVDPEDVKDILTSALRNEKRIARGINGGLVVLGMRTSKMTVKQMTELIELAYAFGAENDVQWSKTSLGR